MAIGASQDVPEGVGGNTKISERALEGDRVPKPPSLRTKCTTKLGPSTMSLLYFQYGIWTINPCKDHLILKGVRQDGNLLRSE